MAGIRELTLGADKDWPLPHPPGVPSLLTDLRNLQTLIFCDLGSVLLFAQGSSVLVIMCGQVFPQTSDLEINKTCIARKEEKWLLTDLADVP